MRYFLIFISLFFISSLSFSDDWFQQGSLIVRSTQVVSAAASTQLNVASRNSVIISGTTTQTITLPDATSLVLDRDFEVLNRSTGAVTVEDYDNNSLAVLISGEVARFKVTNIATMAGVWEISKEIDPISPHLSGDNTGFKWEQTTSVLSPLVDNILVCSIDGGCAIGSKDLNVTDKRRPGYISVTGTVNVGDHSAIDAVIAGFGGIWPGGTVLAGRNSRTMAYIGSKDGTTACGTNFGILTESGGNLFYAGYQAHVTTGGLCSAHQTGYIGETDFDLPFTITAGLGTQNYRHHVLQYNGTIRYNHYLGTNHLVWTANNASDIGSANAGTTLEAPRTIYLGTSVRVGANQVVSSRKTGYADPTGTTDRGTFATSTVTTADLAEFVKAMYEDMKSHGLIGN